MREIAILPPFLAIKYFVRKGCARRFANRNFTSVLAIEPHFMRKGCAGCVANQFYRSFLAIEPHCVRKGCAGRVANHNFTSVFGDRTSFRAKGLRRTLFTNRNVSSVFGDRTSFRAEGLRRTLCKSQLYRSFWRSNLISCDRVAPDALQIATLPQFLAIEPHFVRRGCAGRFFTNRNVSSVFGDRTSLRAKGLRRTRCKSQLSLSFWRSNLISCEMVAFRAVSLALPRALREK